MAPVISSPVATPIVNPSSVTVPLPADPSPPSLRRIAKISMVDIEPEIKYGELFAMSLVLTLHSMLLMVLFVVYGKTSKLIK